MNKLNIKLIKIYLKYILYSVSELYSDFEPFIAEIILSLWRKVRVIISWFKPIYVLSGVKSNINFDAISKKIKNKNSIS